MNDYVITTDNNSDLPESYLREHGVGCTYLSYAMDGKIYTHGDFLPEHQFYEAMRNGSLPTTAQANPEITREMMEPYLKEGKDILHIAFSSGLSGTCSSAILAAREDRPVITMEDMNEAMMKILAGPEKRSRIRLQRDLRITAIHEAGHAVAMYNLPTHDPVRQISIVPRGSSLGATWYLPKEDSSTLTRNEMYEQIVGLLGGRVAEALFTGDIFTGASSDIDRATKLAKDMVARYGMCESLGTVSYLDGGEVFIGRDYQTTKSYSEKVAGTIDDEVKALIDRAYQHCAQLLKKDEEKLMQVVEHLMAHETMTGAQFAACMEGKAIQEASATAMFDTPTEE